ncbi:MAG: 2-hydroxychromene-2-carboxylate isomerase [Pseudomonadota bacterium]
MGGQATFWFELASTYSYLSAARVDDLAAQRGIEVAWRPFLLGPIFAAQGWSTSPFRLQPAKGRYMWRDMARLTAARGLPFTVPDGPAMDLFPQHSVLAARLALVGLAEGWGKAFVRAVFEAGFAQWQDIAAPATLAPLIRRVGGEPEMALTAAVAPEIKQALRANTEAAQAAGIFGAPSVTVGEELFWGDDRLEAALNLAAER